MKFKWENVCDNCKRKAIIIIFKASGKSKRRWLRGDPKSSDLGNCVSKGGPGRNMESKAAGKRNLGRGMPDKLPEENKGVGHILGLRVMRVPWAGETESCPHRKSFLSLPCFLSSPFLPRG